MVHIIQENGSLVKGLETVRQWQARRTKSMEAAVDGWPKLSRKTIIDDF
jgi:hypothetical protein